MFQDKLEAAHAASQQRQWEAAAGFYAEAIPLDPSAGLITLYGHMLKEAGHLRAAVAAYRAAIRWDGTAGDPYVHLGHLLKRLGRRQEAIDVFSAAERIPYGPHVRPEINGLIVAGLNMKQDSRPAEPTDSKPLPDRLRRKDEELKSWLAMEELARAEEMPAIFASGSSRQIGERRLKCLYLEPMANLVIEDGFLCATTANPRMRFCAEAEDLADLAGQWVEISLTVRASKGVIDPILFIEEAHGWGTFRTSRLIRTAQDRFATVTQLPRTFISLRLDPVHSPGQFSVADLEVALLSQVSVFSQMLKAPDRPTLATLLQSPFRDGLKETVKQHFDTDMADDYARWIAQSEGLIQDQPAKPVGQKPLGFITLLTEASAAQIGATIAALKAQTTADWRLFLVPEGQGSDALGEGLNGDDARISILSVPPPSSKQERIARAVEEIDSDVVAFLPAGDQLAPTCVAAVQAYFAAHAGLEILVVDHDELSEQGQRRAPSFKPDWNHDYLLCFDYVGPAVFFARTAVIKAGGWRDSFSGRETYDLLLRVSDMVDTTQIGHLARPVWHRDAASNPGTEDAAPLIAPVSAFLESEGGGRRAQQGRLPDTVRLVWPLSTPAPHVTIIIPTRDRIDLLRTAINSILERTDYPAFDLIVVDNGSVEADSLAYFAEIERDRRIAILRDDGPFNFSRLNNRAAAVASGKLLALVNNDVEILEPGWLAELAAIASDPKVGAVGAKLLYGSGHVQHAGIVGGVGTVAGHGHKYEPADAPGYMNRLGVQQTVIAVTAACLVVDTEKYHAVGGLDEDNLTVAFNDVDLCLKLNDRGWRSVFSPWAVLYHHESLSRGLDLSGERAARFAREAEFMVEKWGNTILVDPFYSPNLTLEHEDFSLRLYSPA